MGVLIALGKSETVGVRPVAYRDVTSIVLDSGKMTLGRRSIVPQMTNVGRHYDASLLPTTMQCSNSGWDGAQFTWKCQAQLANGLELDRVEVVCEDWEAPVSDATINDVMTYGSCGVEYSLRGSAAARVASPTTHTTTVTERTTYSYDYDNDIAIIFVWLFLLFFVGWVFASICCGTSRRSSSGAPPVVHVSGASPAAPVHVTVENPSYSGNSSYNSGYVDGMVTSSFWRPSSWYSRNSWYSGNSWGWGNSNHNVPYTRTTTSSSSSPSSGSSSPFSDSDTHSSTSFGGTRRR